MIESNPKFQGAIVFVPRCANCGTKIINEDEIEQNMVIQMYTHSTIDLEVPLGRKCDIQSLPPSFIPNKCSRCGTEFTQLIVPLKINES